MTRKQQTYDLEYKIQAVNCRKSSGKQRRHGEIPADTLGGWTKATREKRLNTGPGRYTPESAMRSNVIYSIVTLLEQKYKSYLLSFS